MAKVLYARIRPVAERETCNKAIPIFYAHPYDP